MNADVIMIFHRLYLDWGRLTNHAVHGCLDIAKRYATCSFKPYGQEYGRSAAVQKMAYMIRISEGVRFYPEKMKDMNFGAATTRRYKRQATATNSPLCGQHHNPFGCA
jgi:hypothetical protein